MDIALSYLKSTQQPDDIFSRKLDDYDDNDGDNDVPFLLSTHSRWLGKLTQCRLSNGCSPLMHKIKTQNTPSLPFILVTLFRTTETML